MDDVDFPRLTDLPDSGYTRVDMGEVVALIDRAAVGPDYLPGHAHADTLSFELSLFGQRVIVNSGTSVYGTAKDRQQERSTAMHTTVVIDDQDSSEVWGGFRVARRARVLNRKATQDHDVIRLSACHNGYKRLAGKPLHCREWVFNHNTLTITDSITGKGIHHVESVLPLHPDVEVIGVTGNQAVVRVCGKEVRFAYEGEGELLSEPSSYHPEFGLSIENRRLVFHCYGQLPVNILTRIIW